MKTIKMRCSNCAMMISFGAKVCPYCQQDKTADNAAVASGCATTGVGCLGFIGGSLAVALILTTLNTLIGGISDKLNGPPEAFLQFCGGIVGATFLLYAAYKGRAKLSQFGPGEQPQPSQELDTSQQREVIENPTIEQKLSTLNTLKDKGLYLLA